MFFCWLVGFFFCFLPLRPHGIFVNFTLNLLCLMCFLYQWKQEHRDLSQKTMSPTTFSFCPAQASYQSQNSADSITLYTVHSSSILLSEVSSLLAWITVTIFWAPCQLLYPLQSFLQKQTVNLMKCTSPLQWLHNNTRVTFRCHAYHSRPGLSQPLLNDTFSPLSTSLLMFLISVCCQLQIGTCHWYFPSTLQGLSHVLLQCWQPLKGVHRGEKKWGTLCSGKIWQNRSSDRHYQKSILWVQFLYLFMSRKALKCFMVMTALHD